VKFWEENKTNKFIDDPTKPKYFCLNEFPYPSGDALHCGHGTG
jgi:leucyl-tRNA synthetase